MKANTILLTFIFLSALTHGQQVSKQFAKIYEENKFKEVVTLAGRVNTYLGWEDEKIVDDLVGHSYYELQMYDSAVYFETRALSLDNDATSISAWAYVCRARAQYRLGKKEESIIDLEKAIKLDKNRNSVEEARDFLRDVEKNTVPDDRCEFYFSQGQYRDAIAEGRKQLQKFEHKIILEKVGAAYFHIHYYDSAVYFERRALAADNDSTWVSGWAHVFLGMALYNKNDKDNAIAELTKAIQLDKGIGAMRKAENFLDGIINGRSLVIDSLHQVIKDQLNSNNYRAAANTALTFLANNPDNALTWDQLTTAYCLLHNYDSSMYCGQRAIALDKGQSLISCEAHYRLGIDRFMKGYTQGADDEFTAAINERASDNLRKRVKQTRALMGLNNTYADWKTVERDDIVFHFQNKRKIDDVDALMEKYETEYRNARKVLSAPLPKKIDLFVWEHEAFARSALQSDKDLAYTDADYCLSHVAQDNNRSSQIVYILGHWQKDQ